ncbi:carboxypeptidase B-like [Watersipora subatra]|uniref:carboxypeptidase B-like n=1 Tax=Watersipora subatra TaxID=2589382 RepID=UPI00355C9A38
MCNMRCTLIAVSMVLCSLCRCHSMEDYDTFEQHQVLRIVPETQNEIKLLLELEEQLTELDFWTRPYNLKHDVDVRVPPSLLPNIKKYLAQNGVTYSVLIEDVQSLLNQEIESMAKQRPKRDTNSGNDQEDIDLEEINKYILNTFSSHEEINGWLEQIAKVCGSKCSTHDIGYTHEGRVMKLIKISGLRRRKNKAIWIDGGMHGREWISPVTANNIIYQLITEYGTSRCVRHIVENFDWYILPVANPDGYDYSRIRNRMWRKNRRVLESPRRPWWVEYFYGNSYFHKNCYGVDLNRNFGFMWGETGTSNNPCSDIYAGPEAFSEPESVAIQNFTQSIHNKSQLAVYLSLHAYGQYWLYSWGYTKQLPDDSDDLKKVASDGARAIYWSSNRKTQYEVGSAARTLYASSGASDDWTKGELGVKYAFTLELPPSDANAHGNGFLLPTTAIRGVAEATWPGIKTMAARVLQQRLGGSHSQHTFCNYQ